jgi:hypothetical protein
MAASVRGFAVFSVPFLAQLFRVTAPTRGDIALAALVGIAAVAWRVLASPRTVAASTRE